MKINKLAEITLSSPSGSINNDLTKAKINSLLSLISTKKFTITYFEDFFTVAHKDFNVNKKFLTISSHIDTVYEKLFINTDNDIISGTTDNSITNLAAISLIKNLKTTQIVYIFSNKEELSECPFKDLDLFKSKFFMYNICLDVTPFCYHTHFATVENDKFGLGKKLAKTEGVAYIEYYQCFTDEAKLLNEINIKGFSYCIAINYPNNNCHNKNGGTLTSSTAQCYYNSLYNFLNNLF